MIKITHPNAHDGKAWTCSCGELITEGLACGACFGVFCPVCAAHPKHAVPAGERAGKPCAASTETRQAA